MQNCRPPPRVADMGPRLEVVHGVALEMEQRIDDLLDGSANDLDLDPVHTFPRIDGISMKLRQLSDCCPLHQCFGHLAYLACGHCCAQDCCRISRQHPEERPDGTKAAS